MLSRSRPSPGRTATLRELVAMAVVAAFVTGVVVIALRADARTSVRTQTNDGGAWLVNREFGVIGQVNRASMEVSGVVEVSDAGRGFEVEQRGQTVVVHDAGNGELDLVDPRTYQVINTVEVPGDLAGLHLAVVEGGAVVWTESPLRIWRLTAEQLSGVSSLGEVDPLVGTDGEGLVAVTRDDLAIAVDRAGDRLVRFDAGPDPAGTAPDVRSVPLLGHSEDVVALSAIGDDAVLLDRGGAAVVPGDADDAGDVEAALDRTVSIDGGTDGYALSQPASDGAELVAVRPDGTVLAGPPAPPDGADEASDGGDGGGGDVAWTLDERSSLQATDPLAPIVHEGCIFAVGLEPMVLTRTCGVDDRYTVDAELLDGLDRASVRLRLVNGWVWLNDMSTGKTVVIGVDGDAERFDDWGVALGEERDDDQDESDAGDQQVEDDRDVVATEEQQELDEDGANQPPRAEDDLARTRVDAPVVVPVLDNDGDPDGDVILVTAIDDVPFDLQVATTDDHTKIQVIPPAGQAGTYDFEYTITDGRPAPGGGPSAASATVTVEVLPIGGPNEPPVTELDRAEVAAGRSVSLNVLRNDVDPESDAMLLQAVGGERGQVTFDASGQVTYALPANTAEGTISLPYTVRDVYGATAEGEVEVRVRPRDSNNPPAAEHDSRFGVVDRPMTFNVLANDSDADDEPLSIGDELELVSGPDGTLERATLSPDGELFFDPRRAGPVVLAYTASDGKERDTGLIRVDVTAAADNRAPTAIRDDTTIARGASRTIYVLQNDTDQDGDVMAIESWERTEGIRVEETRGSGLNIEVLADAPDLVPLRYSITDGRSDATSGTVMIAVSDDAIVDQPPVARPDPLDVRPGRTAGVRVLLNDYDPEGGGVGVVGVASTPNADVRIGPGGQEVFVTPHDDVFTSFTFGYDIEDEAGNRATSHVLVRPVPERQQNRAPIARPDEARARAGVEVGIDVARNDSDPDGDAIRVESIAAQPALGEATLRGDGTISYRASPDAAGSDRFEYLLVDANGDKSIGVVLVGVLPAGAQNRPPTATDDTFSVIAGGDPLQLDMLANDFDPNGDELAITETSGGRGAVSFDAARGVVTFTPPSTVPRGSREVRFEYTLSDGRGETDVATVIVTVSQATRPLSPIAVSDIVGPVLSDQVVRYNVLDNDLDPDGRRADLAVSSEDPAVMVGDDGVVEIQAGEESSEHVYTVTDADGLTSSAVVTVITTANRPPATERIVIETQYERPVEIDVHQYVVDPDGDELTFACCQSVRRGSASVQRSGAARLTVEYVPDDGFDGEAGFAYEVSDGEGGHQVSGAIVVRVLPPANRPPAASDGEVDVEAGTVGPIDLSQFVEDPDLDNGDRLSFGLGDVGAAPAELDDATVRVRPPIDAAGDSYEIGYRVTDSEGEADAATVRVTVTASTIPPPIAVADAATTTDTEPVDVDVLANDQGEGLRVVDAAIASGGGAAAVTGDSTAVVYTPEPGVAGEVVVGYTIEDERASPEGRASGRLLVTILAPPGTPLAPSASADDGTASVGWATPASNGSPIIEYEVRSDQGQTVTATGNSTVFDGLRNGVAHRFQVRARNEAGWSAWSGPSVPVTPDAEPGQPPAPSVEFADAALDVTWSAPPNEGSPIRDFRLEIGGAASGVRSVGTRTSYRWEGLANGANYQFRIVALNEAGPSVPSAWSRPEHPLRQPGPPSPPRVEVGDGSLALAWSAGDDGGDAITRWEVQLRSSSAVRRADGTTFTWSPLPNGVAQQFRVRAFNRDPDPGAWGPWSAPTTPCGVPGASPSVRALRGDQRAAVAWDRPNDNGCDITGYVVETDQGGAEQRTQATSLTFTPLRNGTPYRFRVLATNSQGDGPWSAWSNTVTPAGPPIGPAQATATPTAVGEITVTWGGADPNGDPVRRYEVSVNNGPPYDVGNVTSWRHTGLGPGTRYEYEVRACNGVSCGAYSAPGATTTWDRPSQLGAPALTANDRDLTATWYPPSSDGGAPVTHYEATISPGTPRQTTSTSTTWTGLSYGTTYSVTVQACNAVDCSDPSPASSATIQGVPDQVAQPVVTAAGNDVTATWNEPGANGSAITRYEAVLDPGSVPQTTSGTARTTTFQDLAYSTTYTVVVRACNGVGCGPYSNPGSATTGPAQAITIRKGAECGRGSPNGRCVDPDPNRGCQNVCNYVHMTATGFSPNTQYSYTCYYNGRPFSGGGGDRTTDSSGTYDGDLGCYLGNPGSVYVVYGGQTSQTYQWT